MNEVLAALKAEAQKLEMELSWSSFGGSPFAEGKLRGLEMAIKAIEAAQA